MKKSHNKWQKKPLYALFFFSIAFLPLKVQAQTIPILTLDAAIDSARQVFLEYNPQHTFFNTPLLKETQATYFHGNLYSFERTSIFHVEQTIGSIPVYLRKKQQNVLLNNLADAENESELIKLDIQVKSAYLKWIYKLNKQQLIQKQLSYLNDFKRINDLFYSLGETTILEKSMVQNKYNMLVSKGLLIDDEIILAYNHLQELTGIDDIFVPEMKELEIYQLPAPTDSINRFPGRLMETTNELSFNVAKNDYSIQKAAKFPEMTIGYLYQNINSQQFSGITVGIKIPFLPFASQPDLQWAKFRMLDTQQKAKQKQRFRESTVNKLIIELNMIFHQLNLYNRDLLTQADLMVQIAEAEYKNENITYFDYVTTLGEAFEIRQSHLDILNEYNQKAIELEFYLY